MAETNHYRPDIEQRSYYEERLKTKDIRSMPVGCDRLAALRDLGATFDEGQHRTTKIATPTGTPKLPTFVDASQIERLLQQKKSPFSSGIYSNNSGEGFGHFNEWR
ncbi:unnamed protein product [Mucor hiemalis]